MSVAATVSEVVNPLASPCWQDLTKNHRLSTVFHSAQWIEAIQRTYNYEPRAILINTDRSEVPDALPYFVVNSSITGSRCVSLPFSDHCAPLVHTPEAVNSMLGPMSEVLRGSRGGYFELRPVEDCSSQLPGMNTSGSFCLHTIDLRRPLDRIFAAFHNDCIKRKLRKAQRHGLVCDEEQSETQLQQFFGLFLQTRRRHRLAPQPIEWFRNLGRFMGDAMKIRIARKDGRPIASILTLRWKKTMVYKYGCSDAAYHHFGGMQMLFWRMIQDAHASGCEEIDLGRSDWDQPNLIRYKDRWGAERSTLTYYRLWNPAIERPNGPSRARRLFNVASRNIFPALPDYLLCKAGEAIYRHLG